MEIYGDCKAVAKNLREEDLFITTHREVISES